MLWVHLLRQWHSLRDTAMKEALSEVSTMPRFAGIELIGDRIPDETTILIFRHLLEKYKLGEQLFETVKAHLSARGMTMRQGTIADATLISATAHTPVAQRFPKTAARAKANLQPHCPTAAGESSKFTKAANNRFTNKPQRRPSGREAASQAVSGRRCLFHPGSGL
jgi:IS5 family transposase